MGLRQTKNEEISHDLYQSNDGPHLCYGPAVQRHACRRPDARSWLRGPKAMKSEHEELHADLERLTMAGGRTGEAAKGVAALMEEHFTKENAYALPPLSLLVPLSQGKFSCNMTGVLNMTNKLQAELPSMLAEHNKIVAALQKLTTAAKAESKPGGIRFAEMLTAHAQGEEQVTYPTALLVGLYVRGKAAQCPK
jgi:hypothetical protein